MVQFKRPILRSSLLLLLAVGARASETLVPVPWCRKGGVMVALEGQGSASVLLFGGKGHDKVKKSHGSSLMADSWVLTLLKSDGLPIDLSAGSISTTEGDSLDGPARVDWSRVPQAPSVRPEARWKASGDAIGDFFVVFGGDDGKMFLNDLWVLPLASALRSAQTVDSGRHEGQAPTAGGSPSGDPGGAPSKGVLTGAILAAATAGAVPPPPVHPVDDDDDTNNDARWGKVVLQAGTQSPEKRRGHTIVALPTNRALMLVGGRKKHHICLHDAWTLLLPVGALANADGSTLGLGWESASWQKVAPLPSQCRWGHASTRVEDPLTKSEMVAVFGGRKEEIVNGSRTGVFDYNSELWFFSLGGSTSDEDGDAPSDDAETSEPALKAASSGKWTMIEAAAGASWPARRDHHSLSYDASDYALYVFGGRTSASMTSTANLNDLWRFSLLTQTWAELRPLGRLPEPRYLHMTAMAQGSLVVFGGEHIDRLGDKKADHKLNDLWAFVPRAQQWTLISKSDCSVRACSVAWVVVARPALRSDPRTPPRLFSCPRVSSGDGGRTDSHDSLRN